eukprot:TRINITY_DN8680_c0_g1_i1.p1 TRINITY_DN8680_c0_g1~~TRINITY_DN8680_c0_g1_i1.p1  ORF type:complete len:159 (-),score=29.65 TRINITY_DN8680_c0_g1_i1:152-580(-)
MWASQGLRLTRQVRRGCACTWFLSAPGVGSGLARRAASSAAAQDESTKVPHLRRRMIPLIKLVHPDFFAQEGATVRDTNESSLQKLNEVLDICQHKLIYGSETTKASRMRLKLAERYTLVFYQYELEPDAAAAAAAHRAATL